MRAFQHPILINVASIFGGEAFARLATGLMALVVARFYGLDALGDYGYALAVASVLLIVPDFGLHLFAVRELATSAERSAEILWGMHELKVLLTAAVLIFALAFGTWGISSLGRSLIFFVLILRIVLQSFSQAAMAIFRAMEKMQHIALQQFLNSTVVVIWTASALALKARLIFVVGGLVAGQFAETLLAWGLLGRVMPNMRFQAVDGRTLWRIATDCFPFGLTLVLLSLNLRVDILVLSHFASSGILGQFHAAVWFVIAMFLAASLLMSVFFPKLSRLLIEPSTLGGDYVLSLVKNALFAAALCSLGIWLCAPRLITLLFGPELAPAAYFLRVLAPALPLVFLNTIFFYIFAAARRRFVCLGTLSFGIVGGTLLSIYLTSRHGAAGTATADVVRELAMSCVYLCCLVQGDHARNTGLALLKVLGGATAILALAIVFSTPFNIRIMWLAAWMVFVLMSALGVLGFPNLAEWRLLTDDRL